MKRFNLEEEERRTLAEMGVWHPPCASSATRASAGASPGGAGIRRAFEQRARVDWPLAEGGIGGIARRAARGAASKIVASSG